MCNSISNCMLHVPKVYIILYRKHEAIKFLFLHFAKTINQDVV